MRKEDLTKITMCVNALNGLSSFLLLNNSLTSIADAIMCQRPKRAFFISTKQHLPGNYLQQCCVNALNGLSSFLQNSTSKTKPCGMCQRPKRAFFISTVFPRDIDIMTNMCVNALNGLSSFLQRRC